MIGRRRAFLLLPMAALAFGIIGACSSDPTGQAPVDGGTEAASNPDAPAQDSGSSDGGADVVTDAPKETAAPPLCSTFPNLTADASPIEGTRKLYELIALRALVNAMDSCELGTYFADIEDPPPSLITCFGKQLAMVAGCTLGGAPIDYKSEIDENGAKCVASAGGAGNTVQVGFRNPSTTSYTVADVDFMFDLVKKAAMSTGMPAADATRLLTVLSSQRSLVLVDGGVDAGPDAFSASTCP